MYLTKTLSAVTVTLAAGLTLCSCSSPRAGVGKVPTDISASALNPGSSDNGDLNRIVANKMLNDSNAMAPNFSNANSALKPFCVVKDPAAIANFNVVTDHRSCEVLGLGSAIGATDRLYLQEAASTTDNGRTVATYVFSKVSPNAANLPESAGREMFSSPEVEFSFRCVAVAGTPVSFKQISAVFDNQVQFVVVGM